MLTVSLIFSLLCSSREVETVFYPEQEDTPTQINTNSNLINYQVKLTSHIRELANNRPTRIDLFEVVFSNRENPGLDAGQIYLDELIFPKFENIEIEGITYRLMDKEEFLLKYDKTYNIHIQGKGIIPELFLKIKVPESPLRLFHPKYNDRFSNRQNLIIKWTTISNFNNENIELSITKKDEEIDVRKLIPDNGDYILDLSEFGFLPEGYYDFRLTRFNSENISKENNRIRGVFFIKLVTETNIYLVN